MSKSHRKKLIEVALPLEAINVASAREKSIRHGHPSTLHLWWARRPLAAARAVIFAQMVDDPSSHPELFPTSEAQESERFRLFRIIEELVLWENTTNEAVLEQAREEIRRSWRVTCADNADDPIAGALFDPEVLPEFLDPFAGGGTLPLEAQRLGLVSHASDLNPVAVLINRAMIEIPPRFAGQSPVHPVARGEKALLEQEWNGAQGLAEDVRYYGKWMRDEAEKRIGRLYPKATLPDGTAATVVAWIWARTVTCPNPACGVEMPLVNSWQVCTRPRRTVWVEPIRSEPGAKLKYTIQEGAGAPNGTIGRQGATCVVCLTAVPLAYIRAQGLAGMMGTHLIATVADGPDGRVYLAPTAHAEAAAQVEAPDDLPDQALPNKALGFRVQGYGLSRWADLFTRRQLHALTTFSDLVAAARARVLQDSGNEAYADAVSAYLSLSIGRLANRCSSQSFWDASRESVQQVFARNAIPMIWVFAEGNPFSTSSGNYEQQLEYLIAVLKNMPASVPGQASQADAATIKGRSACVISTDPPYYDNVPYADLSDFFYVWLRRSARSVYPDLFSTVLVPKAQELIAEPARHNNSRDAAASFFEAGLKTAFERLREIQHPGFPTTIFYAFKQEESDSTDGSRVSTGWERMLQGLIDAGFSIDGTWPIRTEQPGGLRVHGRNSLASSIVLVCRPREITAALATRREFVARLQAELPMAVSKLQHGNVAPVDLAQAVIGPGISIFSQYARVIEADGTVMRVRTALELVNQALDGMLAGQEGDLDEYSRFAVEWFAQYAFEDGLFGDANTLANAKGTAVSAVERAGILVARGGKVRLLRRGELGGDWDPATDDRLTVWEVTQHLAKRLEEGGELSAAELLSRVGGFGEIARELAYRLYAICGRRTWVQEALVYNALVASWPEIRRLADSSAGREQQTLGI